MVKSRFIICALFFLIVSCKEYTPELQENSVSVINYGGDMSVNLSHNHGTVYKYTGVTEENLGVIANLIDGNEGTICGFTRVSPRDPNVQGFSGYQIDLDSEYYVENITVPSIAVGSMSKFAGAVYVVTQNGTSFSVTNIGYFGFNYGSVQKVHFEDVSVFTVQSNIIGVRVSIDVSGYAGVEDTYGAIKEIYINGVDRSMSPIEYYTIMGIQRFAKNNELQGPLRYMTSHGIESLALINVNAPKASNVRIMTPSGVKAIAKL